MARKPKQRKLYRKCPFCDSKGSYTLGINAKISCTHCKNMRVVEFDLDCDQIDQKIFAGEFHGKESFRFFQVLTKASELLEALDTIPFFTDYKNKVDAARKIIRDALKYKETHDS